ncbi:putative ethanolamine kinase 1, partial [Mitosporidium daphniae]
MITYPEAADFSVLKDEIHRLVTDELGIWNEIPYSRSSLLISKCSGGMSNIVLKVENRAKMPPISILVRLFGTGNSLCSCRQRLETFWMSLLSEVGNCPKVLLEFANGRIETFLEDYFTLTLEHITSEFYSMKIARELAAIHKQTDKILKGTL